MIERQHVMHIEGFDGPLPMRHSAVAAIGAVVPLGLLGLLTAGTIELPATCLALATYALGWGAIGWLTWRQGRTPIRASTWEQMLQSATDGDADTMRVRAERDAALVELEAAVIDGHERVAALATELTRARELLGRFASQAAGRQRPYERPSIGGG